ncbi:MAG TPA: hypothetical protein VN736_00410 [Candidatus Limnocylindrales bacterium]|nr:hypothetical protein [Candidatus Limnocylindrales bacterium]
MAAKVTKKGPGLVAIAHDLKRLEKSEVLVGIPANKTLRKGGKINNASLLFILSKGSPINHIPPRPVLEPSIEENKKIIAPHLGAAAKAILDKRPDQAQRELELAGTLASDAAKRYITSGELAPNAPSTIARKGSDQPLIDTGALRRSITFVVREEK